ncbi:MAG TPA: type 4a pilus biogenesis protein PilO [Terriglobia bacterium]|nr:type 4a pilus biogenesis protein PilO [Terriglobia bacterium]
MALELKGFQKLPPQRQVLIVVAVCGALMGLVWYQYISPMGDDIAQKTVTYGTLQQQNARSRAQLQQFAKLKQESDELQAELDRLKRDLPLEKETHEILEDIQRKISVSDLKILRVGPRATVDHEVYTEWPWDFEIIGSYHNLGEFLDRVRNLPRIVSVSNMKINARPGTGPEGQLTSVGATYTATTYVYRDEQTQDVPSGKK